MARICSVCGRGAMKANSRSHSHIATIRKQELNLQTIRLGDQRVKACTSCVRNQTKRMRTGSIATAAVRG